MKPAVVRLWRMIGLAWLLLAATAWAQGAESSLQCPQTTSALYSRIRSVGLDPQRVYHVRDASIDRPNLHLDLDDGTLAFTEDICGRITGAFFEGEGEIRLRPPNRGERGSMALFTGMALLEEQFSSGYLRFNDDTAAVLQRYSTPAPEGAEFIKEWDDTSRTLAEFDALHLLLDFSHFLPVEGGREPAPKRRPPLYEPDRQFAPLLHAHLLGGAAAGERRQPVLRYLDFICAGWDWQRGDESTGLRRLDYQLPDSSVRAASNDVASIDRCERSDS